jgi:hypothetical protein
MHLIVGIFQKPQTGKGQEKLKMKIFFKKCARGTVKTPPGNKWGPLISDLRE